jgi:sugar (pentulose or hexulose) kinase
MRELFVGVDAGSSVLKAVAFDLAGRPVARASERTPLSRRGGGRVEADPDAAWAALTRVLGTIAGETWGAGRIAGLGLSGAMVGAWVVDAEGRTLRPGINWEDSRAQGLIEEMARANPRLLSDIFSVSGSVMQQGCTLPVMAALLREEPEVMDRAAAVMGYKDWLRFRLTGRVATDASEAAVAPGDARRQARDEGLIRLFGLKAQVHLLPEVLPSAALAGAVTAEAARETGLPEGLPVAAGAGDVIANVIGAGGLRAGSLTGLLGTTCMVGLCAEEPVFTPPDLGLLFSLPERHWFRAMVNVAGTLNLDWAAGLLFPHLSGRGDLLARVGALAAAEPVGARGVVYLPYLSESGIIAPVADAGARAQFAGLAPPHGREAMIRAVYEGVAFSVADLCDLLAPPEGTPMVLTGGGARSAFWCRMIAEVTGREVVVPEGAEFGARGAALLAATALGRFPSVAAASASVAGEGTVYRPEGREAAAWASARARYREARDRALGR